MALFFPTGTVLLRVYLEGGEMSVGAFNFISVPPFQTNEAILGRQQGRPEVAKSSLLLLATFSMNDRILAEKSVKRMVMDMSHTLSFHVKSHLWQEPICEVQTLLFFEKEAMIECPRNLNVVTLLMAPITVLGVPQICILTSLCFVLIVFILRHRQHH